MRRPSPPLLPLVLAVVVLIGCGNRNDVTPLADTSPKPTRHSPTTASADPTSAVLAGPLAAFPLALGYPRENGDDHSQVEITTKPASRRFGVCGRTVWDPGHHVEDLIGVGYRGEAEDVRGRTLVRYPDIRSATAAVTAARDAVAACPDEPDGKGYGTSHTVLDASLGEQSLVWTDTYYSLHDGEEQHDTGLVVYTLVRVGRAVLLAFEYGEGNGSPSTRHSAVTHAVRAADGLVQRMRDLPAQA